MTTNDDEEMNRATRAILQNVDQIQIGLVEHIEGRVVSNQELMEHAVRVRLTSDAREFFVWRNKYVLTYWVVVEPGRVLLKYCRLPRAEWPAPLVQFMEDHK